MAGRKKEVEPAAAGWEAIFCSLVLILVAFFAMLCSYATPRAEKMTNFLRSMGEPADIPTFGTPPGSVRMRIEGRGVKTGEGTVAMPPSPDIVKREAESVASAMASLRKLAREMELGEEVTIEKTEHGFKVTVSSSVFFPSGVAEISKEAYPYLDEMIKIAKKTSFLIKIEGYTDNVPIHTPRFPSNWELSTSRAVNVLKYFLEVGNIPAKKLVAVGYSKYHPIASNDTAEGRKKNRRVEFFFEKPKG